MGKIKLVLFDLGEVIILSHHSIAFYLLIKQLGVPQAQARRFFTNPDYPEFARGNITGEEFYRSVVAHLQIPLTLEEVRYVHDEHMYAVDDAVVEIMRRIKVPLAFSTDTNEWQTKRRKELIDLSEFAPPERIICSNEIGVRKGDPGGFTEIVQHLGAAPEEILLVDDSRENCNRAADIGVESILYTGPGGLEYELDQLYFVL